MSTTSLNGLEPFGGAWDIAAARHLLRRTVYGPSSEMIERSLALGLEATVEQLLADRPEPEPPVKYVPDPSGSNRGATLDPDCAFGETWVDTPLQPHESVTDRTGRNRILNYRTKSMDAWTFLLMLDGELSIREKLTMFWHNHFVVSNFSFAQRSYIYARLLREQALGNVRTFTKKITLDSGMLRYLNGADNTRRAPNENYARELLELFTVGKGELAGPGDYSTFTEDDVVAMAQVLTGWRVPMVRQPNPLDVSFDARQHTPGDKQLSHRFGNAVIREAGDQEYAQLIDVIFEQPACAPFLVRELYRWFVGQDISEDVENTIIEPLAQILRDNDYEVVPVLRALLSSAHFFEHRGCMVKSPVDLILSGTQGLGAPAPSGDIEADYGYGILLQELARDLGMGIFLHPSVAGWVAYHQAPQYDRNWVNNLTYPARHQFCSTLITGGTIDTEGRGSHRFNAIVPVLDLAASLENASDPNALVFELAERMYPYQISEEQKDYLKEILIPGLPDYEWTVEYDDYLANPSGPLRDAVQNRLQLLLTAMVQMPEFQLT